MDSMAWLGVRTTSWPWMLGHEATATALGTSIPLSVYFNLMTCDASSRHCHFLREMRWSASGLVSETSHQGSTPRKKHSHDATSTILYLLSGCSLSCKHGILSAYKTLDPFEGNTQMIASFLNSLPGIWVPVS